MAADQVFEFLVNLAQAGPQLAQHREDLLLMGAGFSAGHVQTTTLALKRLVLKAFGEADWQGRLGGGLGREFPHLYS